MKRKWFIIFVFILMTFWSFAESSVHSFKYEGKQVFYSESGSGSSIIIFVHGLFANKEQWNAMMHYFARYGYHCYAIDLPGYGESQGFPLRSYSFSNEAKALEALINTQKLSHVNLVGNSMGAAIVSLYAHSHPLNVKSLAYIGGAVGVSDRSIAFSYYTKTGVNPFIPQDVKELKYELSLLFYTPPKLSMKQMQQIVVNNIQNRSRFNAVYKMFSIENLKYYQHYNGKFSMPLWIAWGEEDQILIAPSIDQIEKRAPRSQIIMIPHCGHLPMIEQAPLVCEKYLTFLNTVR